MGNIPTTKWGNCSKPDCSNKNCACVKVGKNLICIPCHRKDKGQEQLEKSKQKQKERKMFSTSTKKNQKTSIRALGNVEHSTGKIVGSKSELLKKADRLFAIFIKDRDTKDGKFTCPCCNKTYYTDNVESEDVSDEDVEVYCGIDSEGNKIINCMHFVDRDVYSTRFDEDNAAAGCCYCNKKMHFNPKGIEYQNFRKYLVSKIGESAVLEMQLKNRQINKLDTTVLKVVINNYSHKN